MLNSPNDCLHWAFPIHARILDAQSRLVGFTLSFQWRATNLAVRVKPNGLGCAGIKPVNDVAVGLTTNVWVDGPWLIPAAQRASGLPSPGQRLGKSSILDSAFARENPWHRVETRLHCRVSLAPKCCEVSRFSFDWPGNPAASVVLVSESTVFDHVEDDAWTLPNCAAYGMNISRVCC